MLERPSFCIEDAADDEPGAIRPPFDDGAGAGRAVDEDRGAKSENDILTRCFIEKMN